MKNLLLILIFLTGIQSTIFGQREPNPTKDYFIYYLVSGQKYIGVEIAQTDTSVVVRLENQSEITIPKDVLENKSPSLKNGEKTWIHNPNATRYFFAPSGFGLKKKEGYFQNTLLVLNSASYGFTDYFTMGAGVELYTLFGKKPIYFLTPKLSFPIVENFNAGAGVLYLHAPQILDEGNSFSIFYGVGTVGSRETHASFGIGYGYIGEKLAESPILTFNGSLRLTKKFALVSENWSVPMGSEAAYKTVYSFGIRYMEPEFTVDLVGLGYEVFDRENRLVFPFFGAVVPFGKKRFLE